MTLSPCQNNSHSLAMNHHPDHNNPNDDVTYAAHSPSVWLLTMSSVTGDGGWCGTRGPTVALMRMWGGREGGGWVEDRGGRESVCQSGRPGGAGPSDHQLKPPIFSRDQSQHTARLRPLYLSRQKNLTVHIFPTKILRENLISQAIFYVQCTYCTSIDRGD